MSKVVEWGRLAAPDIQKIAEQENSLAILPVGALEQHGPHLPVLTDTQTAVVTAQEAAERVADDTPVLVLPPVWAGLSDHHMSFGGTVSLSFDEFRAVIRGVARSVKAMSFDRLLIVNGHGGNNQALTVIVRDLGTELEMPIVATHTWTVVEERIASILEDDLHLKHACEGETSMMMVISPDDVRADRFGEATRVEAASPNFSGFSRFWAFEDRSPVTGTWGDPRKASKEKGHKLIDLHTEALVEAIRSPALWAFPQSPWKNMQ